MYKRQGYVLYQAVLAVFGLAMPVLYFTGLAHSLVGAVVPSILAVATLAAVSYTHLAVGGLRGPRSEA